MPFTFEATKNTAIIKSVITDPAVWSRIADDYSGKPEEWEPFESATIGHVLVWDGGQLLGLLTLCAESAIHYWLHTRLLPCAYGRPPRGRSRQIAREFLDWLWANGPCERITMNICATNRTALVMATEVGFKEFGVNPKSVMRHGKLQDQIMLGMSRPEGK